MGVTDLFLMEPVEILERRSLNGGSSGGRSTVAAGIVVAHATTRGLFAFHSECGLVGLKQAEIRVSFGPKLGRRGRSSNRRRCYQNDCDTFEFWMDFSTGPEIHIGLQRRLSTSELMFLNS